MIIIIFVYLRHKAFIIAIYQLITVFLYMSVQPKIPLITSRPYGHLSVSLKSQMKFGLIAIVLSWQLAFPYIKSWNGENNTKR